LHPNSPPHSQPQAAAYRADTELLLQAILLQVNNLDSLLVQAAQAVILANNNIKLTQELAVLPELADILPNSSNPAATHHNREDMANNRNGHRHRALDHRRM
jgi:hypothetical protein